MMGLVPSSFPTDFPTDYCCSSLCVGGFILVLVLSLLVLHLYSFCASGRLCFVIVAFPGYLSKITV